MTKMQLYAEGNVGRSDLLEAEFAFYHGAGTCTFYGSVNSNQLMMKVMGLHMAGAAFIHPSTTLRQELTQAATHRLDKIGRQGDYRPLGFCTDERAIVYVCVPEWLSIPEVPCLGSNWLVWGGPS